MSQVLVSIGSNQQRDKNIVSCMDLLTKQFPDIQFSPVYESEAVGFDGTAFYNLVAKFDTHWSVKELSDWLKDLENQHGRDRSGPKFGPRTLDVDILTYDDAIGDIDGVELPREEILKNAFVLLPMADLVPEHRHPVTGESYYDLWQSYPKEKQKLWQIELPNS